MIKTIALALSLLITPTTFSFAQEAPTDACPSGVTLQAMEQNGKADKVLNSLEAHNFVSALLSTLKSQGKEVQDTLPEFNKIAFFLKKDQESVFAVALKDDCAVAIARIPGDIFAAAWHAYEALGTNATQTPKSGFKS